MSTQSKTFKELRAIWDEKLVKSGFKDQEQPDGNLKSWSSHYSLTYHVDVFQAKERYYQLAGQFLHEHKFKDKRERLIWRMHAEGAFLLDIVAAVKKLVGRTSKDGVQKTIDTLAKEMLTYDN